MVEHSKPQSQSTQEVTLPPTELKATVTRLHKSFKDAFEKSRKLPGWNQVPTSLWLDNYQFEYSTESERWNIKEAKDSILIKRKIGSGNNMEMQEISITNMDSDIEIRYEKLTPDKVNPGNLLFLDGKNSNIAVGMMEKITTELPQHED